MSLDTTGPINFKPSRIEGAPASAQDTSPQSLLLDGQQRLTSLYQVTLRGEVVETITPKNKKVKRWFYIDIRTTLGRSVDREDAIIGVPEDPIVRTDFGRKVVLDLSSLELEFAALMYPVLKIFDWDRWQDAFDKHWITDEGVKEEFRTFKRQVLENFKYYCVPVIALDRSTTKEAVCVVFEKVNIKGKPLDAFELVTAMYAASGHELRRDWYDRDGVAGRHRRLAEAYRPAGEETGILAQVSNTDFLQAISLFHTRDRRRAAEAAGKQGKELPAVSGTRQALLNLPLEAYKAYEAQVKRGFMHAAKFLHMLRIYRIFDLRYQSQIVPLAAISAEIADCGNRGENRLKTMRMRISAAYKGVNILLMKEGAQDFRSGQKCDHTVFFGENVDIHHILPQDWCKSQGIEVEIYDSIVKKTPLSYRTSRIIGGVAPSVYTGKLESGTATTPPISTEN